MKKKNCQILCEPFQCIGRRNYDAILLINRTLEKNLSLKKVAGEWN